MIDQVIDDLTTHLLEIVIYAVGIGLTVRVLAFLWRYFWNIEITRYEGGALVGCIAALLAVVFIDRGPRVAISGSAAIIVAYFLFALIRKYVPFIRNFIDREK
jgi:hypothetical protein